MQRRRGGWAWAAVLAGLLAVPARGAPARPAIEVENLRVGFVSGAENNLFKVGAWTPVWVQLRAGDERFAGVMEVAVPDDDGTPTAIRQVVEVGARASARFTVYVRAGTIEPEFTIRLYDRRGRLRGGAIGSSLARIDAIGPDEILLLTLGQPQGVEGIPALPGFGEDKSKPGQEVRVARLGSGPREAMPGRWYGYDAARAVVVDTNDRDVLAALPLRGQALVEWVRRGGHLVVAVGGRWQEVRDSVLGPILPAVPTGTARLGDLEVLVPWVGGSKRITPVNERASFVTKLEGVEARGGKVLLGAGGDVPLVVRGACGFGRVTVVAFDVDQRPFSDWPDRALFWGKALDLRRQQEGDAARPGIVVRRGRIYQSGITDLASLLRQALEQFATVRPVSFGWVAFFIFIYILLIGPGDYLFLKHVLKRMELTWVTFPVIVVTVSLLASVAAYCIKGRDLRVNKVDVVDVDQPAGLARGSSFFDVFSPQNRDYDVGVVPLPLDRDVPAVEEAPVRPPAGTEVLLSWFGVPEPGFGGMGGGQMGLGRGGYAYEPVGGAESLGGVRVPIWSTKCFHARWFGPGPALLDADLKPAGPDSLEGTVTSRLSVPLGDALLAYNDHVYTLGTVAPGVPVRVELTPNRHLSGYLRDERTVGKYLGTQAGSGEGSHISRPDLMLRLMFYDGGTTATSETPIASNTLNGLDLTGQLALDRPMLVGRIDRPASRLVLEHAPSTPKVDETTMLRVILPLGKAGDHATE
ncbi:MAG: hypothetical protein JO116_09245 [Planctomycetaceae bacterium]|nr:hypothetical protein [Planctomycetaceae bacterium]